MRIRVVLLAISTLMSAIPQASASDCWKATNISGYASYEREDYSFTEDGFSQPMLICFNGASGTVTSIDKTIGLTDISLFQFGTSTLAGIADNGQGGETFEVYQIDRKSRKLQFIRSRVGTETFMVGKWDTAGAFVGDIEPYDE